MTIKIERDPTSDIAEVFKAASEGLTEAGYADIGGRLTSIAAEPLLDWLCYDSSGREERVQRVRLIREEDGAGYSLQIRVQGHTIGGGRANTRVTFSYDGNGSFDYEASNIVNVFERPTFIGGVATRVVAEARPEPGCENVSGVVVRRFEEEDEAVIRNLVSHLLT